MHCCFKYQIKVTICSHLIQQLQIWMIVEWKTENDEFAHKKGKMNKKLNGKCFVWSGRVETKIGCLLSVTTHCISTKSLVRWMRWNITKKYMSGNLPWVKIFSIKCKKEQTQQATVEVFYCLILKLHSMANMRWWVFSGNQQNSFQNTCILNNFLHIE